MLKKLLPALGLVTATAIWGSSFLIVKNSLFGINAVTLVTYRFLLAALIFGAIVLVRKSNLRKHWPQGLLLGLITYVDLVLQAMGVKYIPAANSAFITGLFIAFVPVFSIILFRRVPTGQQFVSVGLALAGLWLLTGGLSSFGIGDQLTLINAVLIGLYVVLVDKMVKGKADIIALNFQQFLAVGLLGLMSMVLFRLPAEITSTYAAQSIVFLAVFSTVIAFGLVFLSQKYTEPTTAGIILSTETVFGALVAWIFGHEAVMLNQVAGGVFIFAAIVVSELPLKNFVDTKLNRLRTTLRNP